MPGLRRARRAPLRTGATGDMARAVSTGAGRGEGASVSRYPSRYTFWFPCLGRVGDGRSRKRCDICGELRGWHFVPGRGTVWCCSVQEDDGPAQFAPSALVSSPRNGSSVGRFPPCLEPVPSGIGSFSLSPPRIASRVARWRSPGVPAASVSGDRSLSLATRARASNFRACRPIDVHASCVASSIQPPGSGAPAAMIDSSQRRRRKWPTNRRKIPK